MLWGGACGDETEGTMSYARPVFYRTMIKPNTERSIRTRVGIGIGNPLNRGASSPSSCVLRIVLLTHAAFKCSSLTPPRLVMMLMPLVPGL